MRRDEAMIRNKKDKLEGLFLVCSFAAYICIFPVSTWTTGVILLFIGACKLLAALWSDE